MAQRKHDRRHDDERKHADPLIAQQTYSDRREREASERPRAD